jgi:hypothetical protein
MNGCELNGYEQSQIKSIETKKLSMDNVLIAYEELINLFMYSYQAQDLIEYHLIRIIQKIKRNNTLDKMFTQEEKEKVVEPVKRRR